MCLNGVDMRWVQAIWNWLIPWRWMGMCLVLAWVFTMVRLAVGPISTGGKDLEELYPWAVQKPLKTGDEWAGIYIAGQKMGYSHTRTEQQKDGYLITNRSLMKMRLFGSFQRVHVLSKVRTNTQYQLRQFVFQLQSPMSAFRAEGQVNQDKLHILWLMGKHKTRMKLPYRPSMLPTVLRPYIAAQKPPPGKKLKAVLFDPQSRSYIKSIITVEGYDNIKIKDKTYRALRLRQQYRNMSLLAWIDDDGKIVKEQAPGGMTLLRESAQDAPKGIEEGFDIIRATRIGLVGNIANPTSRALLTLQVDNVPVKSFPTLRMGRQSLDVRTRRLTIRKENPASWAKQPFSIASANKVNKAKLSPSKNKANTKPAKKLSHKERIRRRHRAMIQKHWREQALRATPLVQSKHPKIRRQAWEILKSAKDRLSAYKALATWVNKALRKQSVVGIPNALETLEKRVGDCNEHATLLAALARSVSLPCEIVTGVAYQRGHFYFHAWNECEVTPNRWVSLDATWGQLPSDVTHIVFARGGLAKQMALMQLLGRLRFRIVR